MYLSQCIKIPSTSIISCRQRERDVVPVDEKVAPGVRTKRRVEWGAMVSPALAAKALETIETSAPVSSTSEPTVELQRKEMFESVQEEVGSGRAVGAGSRADRTGEAAKDGETAAQFSTSDER
jgi:hypothetical protein